MQNHLFVALLLFLVLVALAALFEWLDSRER